MADTFEYDVFLSHSSKDIPAVRELAERLKADGLRVWFDEWVIKPGDAIPLAIEQGLESSRTLVLVMSQAALDSEWVTLERHTALFRDPTNQQRRFVPLRLDDCEVPDVLRLVAYADWRERDDEGFVQLFDAIVSSKPTEVSVSEPLKEVRELLLMGESPEKHRNISELLTEHGGDLSFTLPKTAYPRFMAAFESIRGNRFVFAKPSSSHRQSNMALELARYLYAKRELNDRDLEDNRSFVNLRASAVTNLLQYSDDYVCEEYYRIKDLQDLIDEKMYVRTRQPLCEIRHRIQTIMRNFEMSRRYWLFLVKDDERPSFESFFLKECLLSDCKLLYTVRMTGTPGGDEFIVSNHQTDESSRFKHLIDQLKGQKRKLKHYPNGAVFEVPDHHAFEDWLKEELKFHRVTSPLVRSKTCLEDNVPYCPLPKCPAARFDLTYQTIDSIAGRTWVGDPERLFKFTPPPRKKQYGITLVAGFPFSFRQDRRRIEALCQRLKEHERGKRRRVQLFELDKWHSTVVAFRRSRENKRWRSAEVPNFEVINEHIESLPPFFDVEFGPGRWRGRGIVFSKTGEILLCGVLVDDKAVRALNTFRNKLLSSREERDRSFYAMRPNTDRVKHRMSFYATIGKLVGGFTGQQMQFLRDVEWLESSVSVRVSKFRLLHYSDRMCNSLVGDHDPIEFKLGKRRRLAHKDICLRLGMR